MQRTGLMLVLLIDIWFRSWRTAISVESGLIRSKSPLESREDLAKTTIGRLLWKYRWGVGLVIGSQEPWTSPRAGKTGYKGGDQGDTKIGGDEDYGLDTGQASAGQLHLLATLTLRLASLVSMTGEWCVWQGEW